MRIIDPDDRRMVDLPGVGPCPRPVDIDQSATGFRRLKSLRIYRFVPGPPICGDSEVDEVFILPLTGDFDMAITGNHPLSTSVSASGPNRALYMAPDHSYLLTPLNAVSVAYARAGAKGRVPCQTLSASEGADLAEHLRYHLLDLTTGQTLIPGWGGETLVHVVEGTLDLSGVTIAEGQTLAFANAVTLRAKSDANLLIIGV